MPKIIVIISSKKEVKIMKNDIEHFIQSIFNQFRNNIMNESNFSHKIIFTILIIIITFWTIHGIKKLINKNVKNIKTQHILYKSIQKIIIVVTLLLLLIIWVNAQNSFVFIIIIISAISIFSVKNLSKNFVAWFMLIRKKYFKLYDRVEIDGIDGDVIKITPFYFELMERKEGISSSNTTGRTINIPNHILLNSPIYNYTNFRQINWKEVEYHITIDSSWQDTLKIVEKELNSYINSFYNSYNEKEKIEIKKKLAILEEDFNFKTYVLLEEDYIKIVGQFPVNYKNITKTISSLNKKILSSLQHSENIELVGEKVHVKLN